MSHGPSEPRELVGCKFVLGSEGRHKGQSAHVGFLQPDVGQPGAAQAASGRVVPRYGPQKGAAQLRMHEQLVASPRANHPAVGQEVGSGRGGERPSGVLLHQEDGRPRPGELVDDVEDLVGDQRGEPQAGLVQEEQARTRHQGPADGHHLLLASREGGGGLLRPLAKLRESAEDLRQPALTLRPVRLAGHGPQDEVFPHREIAEHLTPLGGEGHAQGDHVGGRLPRDIPPVQQDAPARRRDQAGDGLQQARLSRAVGPHDGHRLSLGHAKIDAEEGLGSPVVEGERLDPEQCLAGSRTVHAVRLIFPR